MNLPPPTAVAAGGARGLHAGALHGSTPDRCGRQRDVLVEQFSRRGAALRSAKKEARSLGARLGLSRRRSA